MKYPGAKNAAMEDINYNYIKTGKRYFIDIFGGSGTVLLNIDSGNKVYDDRDPDLANLFRVIKYSYPEFRSMLMEIIKTRETFAKYYESKMSVDFPKNNVYRAFLTFYNYNVSFGGMGETYNTREKSVYTNMVKKIDLLDHIRMGIKKWTIENQDYTYILNKYDNDDVFFYLDPPYPGKKWYNFNFVDEDFIHIKKLLKYVKGKYMVNFYAGEEIEKLFGKPSFKRKYRTGNNQNNGYKYMYFYTNF